MGTWIRKVVIEIGDKELELSKDEVRELYNELRELLHKKPFEFPPVSCPSVWSAKYVPPPSETTVYPPQPGYITPPTYKDNIWGHCVDFEERLTPGFSSGIHCFFGLEASTLTDRGDLFSIETG